MNLPTRLPLLLAMLTLGLAACGGSSSDSYELTSPPTTTSLFPVFARPATSGTVSNSGYVGRGTDLAVGDSDLNESARGFYTFDLSNVDPQKLVSATLVTTRFHQEGTPVPDLGPDVMVESVDIGQSLDETDFDVSGSPAGVLPGSGGTTTSLDVTEAIKAVGFTRTRFTLRLSFPTLTDGNGDNDFVNYTDPGNQVGSPNGFPRLDLVIRR